MSRWQNSDRRSRLPKDWPQRVKAVKSRDGGRCRKILPSGNRCPRPGTEVDHRVPNDNHSLDNLQLLCHDHHEQKTIAERPVSYTRRKPKPPKRAPEQHPGARRGTLARTDL